MIKVIGYFLQTYPKMDFLRINGEDFVAYESLIRFEKNSQTLCQFSDALKKQVCQLLKKSFMQKGKTKSVIVKILPCHQQRDSHECGMFSIANAVSLAFGYLPSDIRYIGSLRAQLLEMLKDGVVKPFNFEAKNNDNSFCFAPSVFLGNLKKLADCEEHVVRIETACNDCYMPRANSEPMVVCKVCYHEFHFCCYLCSIKVVKAFQT